MPVAAYTKQRPKPLVASRYAATMPSTSPTVLATPFLAMYTPMLVPKSIRSVRSASPTFLFIGAEYTRAFSGRRPRLMLKTA